MKNYLKFYKNLMEAVKYQMLVENTEFNQYGEAVIKCKYDITNKVLSEKFFGWVPDYCTGSEEVIFLKKEDLDKWILNSIIDWFKGEADFIKCEFL